MNDPTLHQATNEIRLYAALLLKFFNEALEERLRAYGVKISSLQHGILVMLALETLTISEISGRLGLDPSTVVRAVDSLERKGLARRGTDPHDRRRHPISIQPEGRALVAAVPVISSDDPPFAALGALGLASATQLRNLLREVISRFPEGRMIVQLMNNPVDGDQEQKQG